MTLIFFFGGGGGEEVRWKTVRTYGKILATPLDTQYYSQKLGKIPLYRNSRLTLLTEIPDGKLLNTANASFPS